jgi:hypothetical protein
MQGESMKTRPLAIACTLALLGTTLWIGILLAGGPPPDNFEQALARASRLDALFYAAYLNAAFLITLPAIIMMTLLHRFCKPDLPEWASQAGSVFIPIYGGMNLFAYLSQVTLVPQLIELARQPETRLPAEALLRLALQEAPGSTIGFFNGLAYALLGIPSIIFGLALLRRHATLLNWGGSLLALSGVASILGIAGALTGNALLQFGVMLGGGLFFLALLPLIPAFFRESRA